LLRLRQSMSWQSPSATIESHRHVDGNAGRTGRRQIPVSRQTIREWRLASHLSRHLQLSTKGHGPFYLDVLPDVGNEMLLQVLLFECELRQQLAKKHGYPSRSNQFDWQLHHESAYFTYGVRYVQASRTAATNWYLRVKRSYTKAGAGYITSRFAAGLAGDDFTETFFVVKPPPIRINAQSEGQVTTNSGVTIAWVRGVLPDWC